MKGRRPKRRSARAFSMLELVIGMTISLAIAGVAMGALLMVQQTQKETMLVNAATRDALLALDAIGADIAYAGVGVPFGVEADFPTRNRRLRPVVRMATARQLAFIGDLPLPNSEVNGLAHVVDVDPAGFGVAVASEVGPCAPRPGCDTATQSLIAMPLVASCSTSAMSAPSCPWGLGKWQPSSAGFNGQLLLLTDAEGSWAWRRVSFNAGGPAVASVGAATGVAVVSDFPGGGANDGQVSRARYAGATLGTSTLATLDRVFYSVETLAGAECTPTDRKCVLARRHCWGEVLDPTSAGFPAPAPATAVTSAVTPAGCGVPAEGTAWEPVVNNVETLDFTYLDRNGATLSAPLSAAALEDVASVTVAIVIARETSVDRPDLVVRARVERTFFLDNGDAFGTAGRK